MKRIFSMTIFLLAFVAFTGTFGSAWGQAPEAGGVPVHLVVTVEAKHNATLPELKAADIMVFEGKERDQVTEWVPAQGDRAGLELMILIDDDSSTSLGSQIQDIRKFIEAQPPSAKIGVAYMQNGIARVAQNPTNDHAQAANALRLPLGESGANASPYFSLSDLVKRWPATTDRRAVVMISSGVDPYYGVGDLQDPYLEAAIDDAAREGILVSAIYTPGAGHFGHSYWLNYWGQIYLSELASKTGGESYYIGFTGSPVTFSPYLDDVANRLQHQYILGFLAKPEKKAGWHNVRLRTEIRNVDLVSAGRVYVPAGQ